MTTSEDDRADAVLTELLQLEHAGWQALCDGTAAAFYARTMAPSAVMVVATGQVLDRTAVLDVFQHAPAWHRYDISAPRVVSIADDVAALVYQGRGWRSADDPPFVATMTSTYRRHHDAWRLVMYHQVPHP